MEKAEIDIIGNTEAPSTNTAKTFDNRRNRPIHKEREIDGLHERQCEKKQNIRNTRTVKRTELVVENEKNPTLTNE